MKSNFRNKIDPLDIIGQEFYFIKVLSYDGKRDGRHFYKCLCTNCNKEIILIRNVIGIYKSCGCYGKITNPEDIIGQTFGKITVESIAYKKHHYFYNCVCTCGKHTIVERDRLIKGYTKSCNSAGCKVRTHGMHNTRFYGIWTNMRNRCNNPNNTQYYDYGGRGITVCNEWNNRFENFRDDMYESYLDHCEKFGESDTFIDRIDNSKGYNPNNCRWATRREQNINRRNVIVTEYCGQLLPLPIIYDLYCYDKNTITYDMFFHRYTHQGLDIYDSLFLPPYGTVKNVKPTVKSPVTFLKSDDVIEK